MSETVLLKLTPQIWMQIVNKKRLRGLTPRYDEPFELVERVGEVSYKSELMERLKIHLTYLKPYF